MKSPILVPKLNNNDDACVLLEWRAQDGQPVEAGDTIAVLETSKATVELTTDEGGVLLRDAQANETYAFGATIGWIFSDAAALAEHRRAAATAQVDASAPLTITDSAKALIAERGLTDAQLRSLGKTVIKRADVEALTGATPPAAPTPSAAPAGLDRRQAAIARVVSQSHATIPRAFLLVRVDCERALALSTELRQRDNVFVGLPELLVRTVARLKDRFPRLYSADGKAPAELEVGVTFDLGKGLFIPVVRDASRRSLKEIATTLAEYKMKAARDQFAADDLRGGHISISLNMANDVVLSLPIVLPGQICMVSIGGLGKELRLVDDKPVEHRFVHVGVAYDHRFVNGFDAMQFATALKRDLESVTA